MIGAGVENFKPLLRLPALERRYQGAARFMNAANPAQPGEAQKPAPAIPASSPQL